ncbi:hypothetical protein PLESTB_001655300 [Pleodorina starrii]|uniref:Uncharacterized protein n=1 Tax=Pleodorina starrii TaxID=330485 RepID=A0A9W6BYT0_9CHLO|nr:hypothetical protein PLESTB_001655300 [Pleodorina starrii]
MAVHTRACLQASPLKRNGDFDSELEELEDLARAAANNKKQMAKAKAVVQAAAVVMAAGGREAGKEDGAGPECNV